MDKCDMGNCIIKASTKDKFLAYLGSRIKCQVCGATYKYNWKKESLSLAGFACIILPLTFISRLEKLPLVISITLFLFLMCISAALNIKVSKMDDYIKLKSNH